MGNTAGTGQFLAEIYNIKLADPILPGLENVVEKELLQREWFKYRKSAFG